MAVPDFFYGDPFAPDSGKSIQDWIKNHGVVGSGFLIYYKIYLSFNFVTKGCFDSIKSSGIEVLSAIIEFHI